MQEKTGAPILSLLLLTSAFVLFPLATKATELTVSTDCTGIPDCFATISAAITKATTSPTVDNIKIQAGTYAESPLSLLKDVSLTGVETARTVIRNSGTGALFTATNAQNITISKLTIEDASTGFLAVNSSNIKVTNNIFLRNGIAVQFAGSTTSSEIVNNTFLNNQTAISSTADIPITNNIFSGNDVVLSAAGTSLAFTNVKYNLFDSININGNLGPFSYDPTAADEKNIPSNIPGRTNADPKFVAPSSSPPDMDLHLQEGSGAIGTGLNNVEIGAFGGTDADTIPFRVSISSLSSLPSSSTSVSIAWTQNKAANVTNSTDPGSYIVRYNLASGPTTSVIVISPATSTIISGLTNTAEPPGQPILNVPEYADGILILSWSLVPNATGYKVHVLDSVSGIEEVIDVGNTIFFILSGLVNGREYGITVSAYSKATYNFTVAVRDNSGGSYEPGVQHESVPSEKKTIPLGNAVDGLRSSPTQTTYPDPIVAGPSLPDKGCFIATAAYGSYSPELRVLRRFRDRYLMTNMPGKAFVGWYYRYGPVGADFLNAHPWLKPVARTILLPAVGGAWIMTETGLSGKIMAILFTGIIFSIIVVRKKSLRSGGVR